jgi:hypothetical protein
MNLGADMMRDQPDDAFAIGGGQHLARIGQPFGEPVDPEPPVGFSITSTTAGSSSQTGRWRRRARCAASARRARPTTITRHGRPAAVVVPIADARRLYPDDRRSFADLLLAFPAAWNLNATARPFARSIFDVRISARHVRGLGPCSGQTQPG